MKILLSAYACEPNKGSEPGVGWGWACELSKNNEVWVLTRDNNKENIESYQKKYPEYNRDTLHFIYVGLPPKLTFWKKGRRGMRLYYMLWQRKAAKVAKDWHKKIQFDWVQHATFVSYTQPTYMYKLGIPLIWGPVSGGENIPKEVKLKLTLKEQIIEIVRKLSQMIALLSPSIRKTLKASKYILVATEETKNAIPKKYLYKTAIMPAIGLEEISDIKSIPKADNKVRIVMAGRLIYWKAFDIGLKAYLTIADKYPNTELHILGEGNKKKELESLSGKYLNKQVFFKDPVPHDLIFDFYSHYDVFLNTTLRDSGCMTMMEAMAVGLPCVVVATGGPKTLAQYGRVELVDPDSYEELIEKIATSLKNTLDTKNVLKTSKQELQGLAMSTKVNILLDKMKVN